MYVVYDIVFAFEQSEINVRKYLNLMWMPNLA